MDEIYENHIRPMESKLIRALWRLLGDEQDVGDSLQDALTHIWKNRWQLQSHPNPSAWMMRIALNAAYDRLRLRRTRAELLSTEIESGAPSASSLVERQEMETTLLAEIARLSPKQAQALLLRSVEDLPFKVIGEAMGCSEATARVHVQRGRERLRERLKNLDPLAKKSPP